MVIIGIIVLLCVLADLSGQSQIQKMSDDHQKVLQSDLNQQSDVLAQLQQVITQSQQNINQTLQQVSSQTQTNQQALLQAINQQQQQNKAIVATVTQLQQQMQALQKTVNVDATAAAKAASSGNSAGQTPSNKISPDYHIFAVEPYGVIIENNQGQFQIARIGKKLDIGAITSISATEVKAGDWSIVPAISNPNTAVTPAPAQTYPTNTTPVVNNVPMSDITISS